MRILKQSTSVDVPIGPFLDDTDGKTAETALTITQPDIRLKKNGGNWAQKNAAQTLTHEENGNYEVTLDATDTNTLGLLRLHVSEAGALPVWEDFMVVTANVWDTLFSTGAFDVNVTKVGGTAQTAGDLFSGIATVSTKVDTVDDFLDTEIADIRNRLPGALTAAGNLKADVEEWRAAVPLALSSSLVQAATQAIGSGAITATSIASSAFTSAKFASGALDIGVFTTALIRSLRSSFSGIADSGTTTTMVDAGRVETITDYWKDSLIHFSTGANVGLTRLITAFDPATDTITFYPPVPTAVTTETYELLVMPGVVDLRAIDGADLGGNNATLSLAHININNPAGNGATIQGTTHGLFARGTGGAGVFARGDGAQGDYASNSTGGLGLEEQLATLPADTRDAVFARAFSAAYSSLTFDELVKLIAAVLLGKASGMGTSTGTFRNLADSADAVVATIDANGNRTAVTRTP